MFLDRFTPCNGKKTWLTSLAVGVPGAHKLAARLVADAPLEEKRMVMCKLHSLLFGGISEGNRAAAEVLAPALALQAPWTQFC